MTSKHALEQIAEAGYDVEDAIRGVCGQLQVNGVEAVRAFHAQVILAGWKRQPKKEGFSKLEHRVYRLRKRWLTMTVGNFLGVFAEIEVSARGPY